MNTLVIDASVAIKWVIEEEGTAAALVLQRHAKLIAPELLIAECANILWKKVQRGELLKAEALFAAKLLQGTAIELLPTLSLLEATVQIATEIDHPAYDCLYLALAIDRKCRVVTADERLLRKLGPKFRSFAVSLSEATA